MAGGFGVRLYPLTINKSKCLLEVKGKPIIDYTMDKLNEINELDETIIITNETFYKDFVEWSKDKKNIRVLSDGGTSENSKIGALKAFLIFLDKEKLNEDIFLAGADNFFKFSLKNIHSIFKKENKDLAVFYDIKDLEKAKRFGIVLIKDNLIIDFQEKPSEPKSTLCSAAMYFFKKETLSIIKNLLSEEIKKDNLGMLLDYLYKKVPIYAYVAEEGNIDIGSKELLEMAEKKALSN